MAADAVARDARVVELGGRPRRRRVAVLAGVVAGDVRRALARGDRAVVAGEAAADHLRVVDAASRASRRSSSGRSRSCCWSGCGSGSCRWPSCRCGRSSSCPSPACGRRAAPASTSPSNGRTRSCWSRGCALGSCRWPSTPSWQLTQFVVIPGVTEVAPASRRSSCGRCRSRRWSRCGSRSCPSLSCRCGTRRRCRRPACGRPCVTGFQAVMAWQDSQLLLVRDVRRVLAGGARAVVAAHAVVGDAGVIEARRRPGRWCCDSCRTRPW